MSSPQLSHTSGILKPPRVQHLSVRHCVLLVWILSSFVFVRLNVGVFEATELEHEL